MVAPVLRLPAQTLGTPDQLAAYERAHPELQIPKVVDVDSFERTANTKQSNAILRGRSPLQLSPVESAAYSELLDRRNEPIHLASLTLQPLAPATSQAYGRGRYEGWSGACLSSSVAALLSRYGQLALTEGVDASTRATYSLGGSLEASADYIRRRGVPAAVRTGGNWDLLKTALKEGQSVIVCQQWAEVIHATLLVGMGLSPFGEELIVFQTWASSDKPTLLVRTRAEFERDWRDQSLAGIPRGLSGEYIIADAPGAALPPDPSPLLSDLQSRLDRSFMHGFHAVGRSFSYMGQGEFAAGASRFAAGTLNLAATAPFMLVQIAAGAAERLGEHFLRTPLAPIAACFWLVGWTTRNIAQILGALSAMFASLGSLPLMHLSDWLFARKDAMITVSLCAPGTDNWIKLQKTPLAGKAYLLAKVAGDRALTARILAACQSDEERRQLLAIDAKRGIDAEKTR